jgi:hypothetical protein
MKMALDGCKKCKRRFLSVQTKSAGIALLSGEVKASATRRELLEVLL